MDYETLLEQTYDKIIPTEVTERFEVMKVKGHHQGTKTVVSNFQQILSHIRRSKEHALKFLSKELASQAEFNNSILTFSRRLASKDINEKISKYVKDFVLCKKCQKPDTELIAHENKTQIKCLACGEKREVHRI